MRFSITFSFPDYSSDRAVINTPHLDYKVQIRSIKHDHVVLPLIATIYSD